MASSSPRSIAAAGAPLASIVQAPAAGPEPSASFLSQDSPTPAPPPDASTTGGGQQQTPSPPDAVSGTPASAPALAPTSGPGICVPTSFSYSVDFWPTYVGGVANGDLLSTVQNQTTAVYVPSLGAQSCCMACTLFDGCYAWTFKAAHYCRLPHETGCCFFKVGGHFPT